MEIVVSVWQLLIFNPKTRLKVLLVNYLCVSRRTIVMIHACVPCAPLLPCHYAANNLAMCQLCRELIVVVVDACIYDAHRMCTQSVSPCVCYLRDIVQPWPTNSIIWLLTVVQHNHQKRDWVIITQSLKGRQ